MKLTETHLYTRNHNDFNKLNYLCFLSKNLYNSALYLVRKEFCNNKTYLNYYSVNKILKESNQIDYRALPSQISQQTLKLLDKNFMSFFATIKKGCNAKIPKYLDKLSGRQVVHITKPYIKRINNNEVYIRQFDLTIKTRIDNIQYIKIVPENKLSIKVLVGYNIECSNIKLDYTKIASIDLGIDNLATLTFNDLHMQPIIINGKPLKSINQFYNMMSAKIYSKPVRQNIKLNSIHEMKIKLSNKRNNKVNDYMHKASRYIVNHLVENQIGNLVIGYNTGWKQDTNLGRVNNQNFVSIPFVKFINMLKYKCKLVNINVDIIEEAYTSKCSFLDNESIEKHDTYLGKRVYRGLFKSAKGILINADVNGSLNIMKKYFYKNVARNLKFKNLVEGVVLSPMRITV